jgi:hypothetical protein
VEVEEEEPKQDSGQLQFVLDEAVDKINRLNQQTNRVVEKFEVSGTNVINKLDELMDSGEVYTGKFTHSDEIDDEEEEMSILDNDESVVSVFSNGEDENWDYKVELEKRNPNQAYTVHRDEYFENPDDHRQTTLTYYQGDNILCDTDDTPIYDPENFVGKVLEFGRGSQDPNVVYIRNERLQADYEVLLDHGYYQVEVLGQALADNFKADEVKHHKFRPD